ncbi:MAG: hypothetical protein M2R45_05025 [Verrucomicrobia subdivision 3 bacterium]|nr:hypothetical protein [Limisphaerales bacterium]MCS1417648.1 hypothetical protein [Limisphaerales bacterium]
MMIWLVIERLKLFGAGLALLSVAVLLPIHLRAIDSQVVQFAGLGTISLKEEANNQLLLEKPGIAELLLDGAQQCGAADLEAALTTYNEFRLTNPDLIYWGGVFPDLETIPLADLTQKTTVIQAFVVKQTRETILQRLKNSRRPGVQTILKNRYLTHTAIFPPVTSPGGAMLDMIITIAALLSQGDYLNTEFRLELERLAADANRGHSTQTIESTYLDLLAFAKRMNWAQFSGFMTRIDSRLTLRRMAHALSAEPEKLPVLFSAVWMSPSAAAIGNYLQHYPESGLNDLSFGLAAHQGGLKSILNRQERIHHPGQRTRILRSLPIPALWASVAEMTLRLPWLSLLTKYLAVLLGLFCWIRLAFILVPRKALTPMIFRVEGIATLRQQVLALITLALTILLGEPFLAQSRQSDEIPLNWRFPTAPAAVIENVDSMIGTRVDEITLLALALFFLIQMGLYALCLVKLKEIKKQKGSSRLKLKLLDNEDNMFDVGLYVGLGGTVLSLLFLTLKLVQVGLMAAYASTLFGIIFVSLLKIFHVRPYRRKLLIEAEAGIL